MGVIMCPEHGRSGIAFACTHVADAVNARSTLPARSHVKGEIVDDLLVDATYCTACISKVGPPMPPEQSSPDDLTRLTHPAFDPRPVCARCLAAAEARVSAS